MKFKVWLLILTYIYIYICGYSGSYCAGEVMVIVHGNCLYAVAITMWWWYEDLVYHPGGNGVR